MMRLTVLLLPAVARVAACGTSHAVAKVVVSQGATAPLPVSPDIVRRVQDVSDHLHQIGSLPTGVAVAGAVDTSVYATAVTSGE